MLYVQAVERKYISLKLTGAFGKPPLVTFGVFVPEKRKSRLALNIIYTKRLLLLKGKD
jgi:hypothetical protein